MIQHTTYRTGLVKLVWQKQGCKSDHPSVSWQPTHHQFGLVAMELVEDARVGVVRPIGLGELRVGGRLQRCAYPPVNVLVLDGTALAAVLVIHVHGITPLADALVYLGIEERSERCTVDVLALASGVR